MTDCPVCGRPFDPLTDHGGGPMPKNVIREYCSVTCRIKRANQRKAGRDPAQHEEYRAYRARLGRLP